MEKKNLTYSGRRSKMEIIIDVLAVISSGASKPTHIMYKANLGWQPLMDVFDALIDKDLITRTTVTGGRRDKRVRKTYEITDKGRDTLEHLRTAKELMGE